MGGACTPDRPLPCPQRSFTLIVEAWDWDNSSTPDGKSAWAGGRGPGAGLGPLLTCRLLSHRHACGRESGFYPEGLCAVPSLPWLPGSSAMFVICRAVHVCPLRLSLFCVVLPMGTFFRGCVSGRVEQGTPKRLSGFVALSLPICPGVWGSVTISPRLTCWLATSMGVSVGPYGSRADRSSGSQWGEHCRQQTQHVQRP